MSREKVVSVTIHDCRVEAIASTSGGGGQKRNRRHTAIRITHQPSGAVGYSADERSQYQNKVAAFKRMAATVEFQRWLRVEHARRLGQPSVDELVDAAMAPDNIKVEARGPSGWVDLDAPRLVEE